MRRIRSASWRLISNFDWILTILLAVFFAVAGIVGYASPTVVISATLGVLCLLATSALRDRNRSELIQLAVREVERKATVVIDGDVLLSDRRETGIMRVLPNTVNFDTLPLIASSTEVIMIKLRHNFTENPLYLSALEKVLQSRGSVTLIMSDPRSPAVWLRYVEEPTSLQRDQSLDPTVWINGLEDLAQILDRLHRWKLDLQERQVDISKLTINISAHYPTQAFYRFGNVLYAHDYPFRARGFHAPAYMYTDPATAVYQFHLRSIASIVSVSTPLDSAIADIKQQLSAGMFSDHYVRQCKFVVMPTGYPPMLHHPAAK